jgi:predicted GNAT family acetyltransferase
MVDAKRVVNNPAAGRYELRSEEWVAFAEYQIDSKRIFFTHTEVPAAYQGRGIGSALARGALEDARVRELEVVPFCPFIANFIRAHPEYLNLIGKRHRQLLGLEPDA